MAQRQFRLDDTDIWLDRYGDGSDGEFNPGATTDSHANTSCTGTENTTSLSVSSGSGFSDGDLILIHQLHSSTEADAGKWELNKIASGGGTTTFTLAYPLTRTYTSLSQVYLLPQYSSITIDEAFTGRARLQSQVGGIIALLCNGKATISSTISNASASDGVNAAANNRGFPGAVGVNGRNPNNFGQGTKTAVGESGTAANGSGGGGGNGGGTGGGGGGNASAGTSASGSGGNSSGNASLTIITPGGGGGAPGGDGNNTAHGGNGGGIVIIIAKEIEVTGAISVNGSSGTKSGQSNGGGGGGAGGSILLKGQIVNVGANLLTAAGGGSAGNGGAGSSGRIHVDYGISFTGSATPTIDSSQDNILLDPVPSEGYAFFM